MYQSIALNECYTSSHLTTYSWFSLPIFCAVATTYFIFQTFYTTHWYYFCFNFNLEILKVRQMYFIFKFILTTGHHIFLKVHISVYFLFLLLNELLLTLTSVGNGFSVFGLSENKSISTFLVKYIFITHRIRRWQ